MMKTMMILKVLLQGIIIEAAEIIVMTLVRRYGESARIKHPSLDSPLYTFKDFL